MPRMGQAAALCEALATTRKTLHGLRWLKFEAGGVLEHPESSQRGETKICRSLGNATNLAADFAGASVLVWAPAEKDVVVRGGLVN